MLNYIFYRIGQFIALATPLRIAYAIAIFFSGLKYIFDFRDRVAMKENLKTIFPEKSEKEIRIICLGVYHNFAKYLVDFFRFSKINPEYIRKNIKLENREYFEQALSRGRGVVVLTAHLGNWELGGIVISLLGYPFWAVALPHRDKRVNKFFNHQRECKGVKVIPLNKAVRQGLNVLKEKEMLALVGDRDFTEKGVVLDFFGKPTLFPIGPAAISLKTGAMILPGFMVRNDDDSFTLRMEQPIDPDPINREYSDKDKALIVLIQRYKVIIESYIHRYPQQWYMFKKFWIEDNLK